jgi:transcriptional regulator with XRE-family HTH domain
MATRYGGQGRVSTKAKLADELVILGEVIVRAREAAAMKQNDVAAKLGVPASWLSKVESGTRRLDVIELIRIAEAIEVEPGELIDEIRLALVAMGREKG